MSLASVWAKAGRQQVGIPEPFECDKPFEPQGSELQGQIRDLGQDQAL